MSSIDERIVKMTFDNSSFESNISKTIQSLEKLNNVLKNTGNAEAVKNLSNSMKDIKGQMSSLNFDELNKLTDKQSIWQKIGSAMSTAGKGIANFIGKLNIGGSVEKIASSFGKATEGSNSLEQSVGAVSRGFSALGVVGATALANITNGAVNAGKRLVKALTIDPIATGFSEYELKMNSISTILANTADEGATLDDVTKALNELNEYSDQTIYNFAQMTDNIGKFTAAGVGLEDSVAAIKGMSNLAAFFGVDNAKAAGAMHQMSQALAAGKVQLMDWTSLVNAGMSGEAFQKALIRTSEQMGTGAEAMIEKYGSFRDSLTKGEWLTGDVMLETLKQISGAYKESELRAQGYSAAEAKAISDMAKRANKAATEVRTITGMMDAMKESVQSGWAISWEHIIGDKEEATKLLTGIKDAFDAILKPSTDARNEMLAFWNEAGGRDDVIKGFTNIFQSLGKGMKAVGDAWREVFPAMTGAKLTELSGKFKDLTEKFKMSDDTAKKIKDTFKGVFDILGTGKDAVVDLISGFTPLVDLVPTIGSAFLSLTSGIGKVGSSIAEAVKSTNLFSKIGGAIKKTLTGIGDFFEYTSTGFDKFFDYLSKFDFGKAFGVLGQGVSAVGKFLKPAIDGIGKALGSINFETIMKALNTATFIKVLSKLKDVFVEVEDVATSAKGVIGSLKGVGSQVKEVLTSAKDTLQAMQDNLEADRLMKLAAAIGILAGSLLLISTIDTGKLLTALAGLGAMMAMLVTAFRFMEMTDELKGFGASAKFVAVILSFSTALLLMSGALKILSTINLGEMLVGLTSLLSLLGVLSLASKMFSEFDVGLDDAAKSMSKLAISLMLMAGALKLLGSIDAATLGSGLFTMALVLTELALFTKTIKTNAFGPSDASGILALAAGMIALAAAVKMFGSMDIGSLLKGITGMGSVLAAIVLFEKYADGETSMLKLAAGITAMGVAMIAMSLAIRSLGSMDIATLAKGLLSLGISLAILSNISDLLKESELVKLGVGIGVASVAILLLSAALHSLGSLSLGELETGLIALTGSLLMLYSAANAMTSCIPGAAALLILSAALAIFTPQLVKLCELNLAQVLVGLVALAGGLAILGGASALLVELLPAMAGLAGVLVLFGAAAALAGAGIALFGTGFAAVAAAIGVSGFAIIEFIRNLINLLPQIGTKAGEAMVSFASAVSTGGTEIINAFSTLLSSIITAIRTNIPLIVDTGVELVLGFAEGLAKSIPQLVTYGIQMITGVLSGIADNIGKLVDEGCRACVNFINGIAANIGPIIDAGINLALSFIEGVANGITSNQGRTEAAVRSVIQALLTTGLSIIRGGISGFLAGGKQLLQGLVNGIKSMMSAAGSAVRSCVNAAKNAASNLGGALLGAGKSLIQGLVNGITSMASSVASKARNVVQGAIDAAKKALKINSPSKVFIGLGKSTTEGFVLGMERTARDVIKPAENLAKTAIDNTSKQLAGMSKLFDSNIDANPVISPVLDLTNVEQNSRRIGDLVSANGTLALQTDKANLMTNSIGTIQNGKGNSDIVSALKDLKDSMSDTRPSYTINGITYDDGSNVVNAVETLVRAARIERRI